MPGNHECDECSNPGHDRAPFGEQPRIRSIARTVRVRLGARNARANEPTADRQHRKSEEHRRAGVERAERSECKRDDARERDGLREAPPADGCAPPPPVAATVHRRREIERTLEASLEYRDCESA